MNFRSHDKKYSWILFTVTVLSFIMVNFVWPDQGIRRTTIDGDGRGHYVYLPLIFIEHSVDFKNIAEKEKKERAGFIAHNFHTINGTVVNKYPVGTALLITPFFITAHLINIITGRPADGFSIIYQYAVALAALFWLLIGLFYLKRLMELFNIEKKVIFWSLLFLILGTNLFHYAFLEVSLSHLYSFSFITLFLFYSKKIFLRFNTVDLVKASFLLGIVILIRNINVMVILALPFMASGMADLKKTFLNFLNLKNLSLSFLMVLAGFSPQLILNLVQTGKPYVDAYLNEGFDFLHPEFSKFLFSFQKGWFIYTPAWLLLFPAAFSLYKHSKYHFFTFIFFLLSLIYLFSSWWNWFFGDSFGMRPMVDYYGLFTIVIALWVNRLHQKKQLILIFLLLPLSLLNLIQSYQYSKGIIHVDSMDFKAYRYVFLKTASDYKNCIGPDDEYFYGKLSTPILKDSSNFFILKKGWKNPDSKRIKQDKNGFYLLMNEQIIYGPSFRFIVTSSLAGKKLYLKIRTTYSELDQNAGKRAFFILEIKNKAHKTIFYKGFPLKKIPDYLTGFVLEGHAGIKLPTLKEGDLVKFYIWNKGKKHIKFYQMDFSLHEIISR